MYDIKNFNDYSNSAQLEQAIAIESSMQKDNIINNLTSINMNTLDLVKYSKMSLAINAAGFAGLLYKVNKIDNKLANITILQEKANDYLCDLVEYSKKILMTNEKILSTLLNSRTVEAEQLIRQGWTNLVNGYTEEAFSRFIKSLEYDNTLFVSNAELARLYENRGDNITAESHYIKAIAFSKDNSEEIKGYAHVKYSLFLEKRERLQEAIQHLNEAINCKVAKDIYNSWAFHLAEVFARLGIKDKSINLVSNIISNDIMYFNITILSNDMKLLQPQITELLVSIDEKKRKNIANAILISNNAFNDIKNIPQISNIDPESVIEKKRIVHELEEKFNPTELMGKCINYRYEQLDDLEVELKNTKDYIRKIYIEMYRCFRKVFIDYGSLYEKNKPRRLWRVLVIIACIFGLIKYIVAGEWLSVLVLLIISVVLFIVLMVSISRKLKKINDYAIINNNAHNNMNKIKESMIKSGIIDQQYDSEKYFAAIESRP